MKSILRNARISPKKLNVIAYIVRDMPVQKALDTLQFMPKKGADLVYKALHSALSNATHNDSQDLGDLKISSISICPGIVYKRINPVSRGRSHRILKRTSHINIELSVI